MRTTSNRLPILLYILATIVPFGMARAQDQITVITQIKPPYSPYLSDYVGFDNKIVVTLINKENSSQSVRLVGQIKGGTGLTVTIPNTFVPAAPITIGPNQSRMLTGVQLKEYLSPDVLEFSGISKQEVVQGNGLPEGNYSFCIQALDFQTGQPRSLPSPSGCVGFTITHYEPPTILQPQCNGTVVPNNPQNLLFSWTAPAGAPPNKMEYILKIVEIFPQDADPNQAMLAAPDPPFFETVVQSTSFLFGPAAPHLEIGMRYAVRVTARNKGESKELNFKNGGNSVVCAFTYGQEQLADDKNQNADNADDDQNNNDIQEEYANPCTSLNCAPQPPPSATESNTTYHPGDEIQIGYFTLKLTSLASNAANNLSGEGVIDAPIFKTRLKATFQGLKVNPQHKVYSGKAIGAYDPGAQVDQALKDFGDKVGDIAVEKVKTLSDFVKSHEKYIENFVDLDAQGLPFAWKKVIDGKLQLVDIASVEFAPDGARFNAFFEIPIPEANNKILAFGQKNICFHPTGLSVDGLQKLTMLGDDKTFSWGENIDLTLKAAQGKDGGTYVKWDCEGYKGMQIDGYFTLKTTILEKAEGGGPVKASFTFSNVASWGDIVGDVSMDPFVIKGTKGLKLAFEKVVLDFSDTRNAQGMAFPANYNGPTSNDWRGFYFKKLSIALPKYLKNKNAPVEITMQNALITKLGFTGSVTVQPVVSLGDGNLGGWAFSMEKISIEVLNNSLAKGEFNGSIRIPIASTALGYKCLLSNSDQGLKTAFQVSTLGDIDAEMWAAKLSLKEGSGISIQSQGDDVTVKAVLSGSLTIDKKFADLKGVSVKIPGVEFQDLTVQNKKPYLSATLFKFASPQKFFAGFPVSIDPQDGIQVKFTEDGTKAGLRLGFHVGLDGNEQSAISGGTAFTLWAQMSQQNGKQVWKPATPTLESIAVKASVASCDIEGKIDLYKGDEKFGDGFRGSLMVNFRPIVKLSATVQFGSTNYKANATYRYWYVDAMAVMGQGIPVYPGFGIYGFGGGAYYHMKPESVLPTAAELEGDPNGNAKFQQDTPGQATSGVEYGPDKNIAFGFKATIVMGTMPKPNAFNGDITLEASFFQGGGLNEISLSGNGYFVSVPDPKHRPAKNTSVVTASVMFKYSGAKKSFDGLIDIHINLKSGKTKLIEGGGQASLHFSKDKWFIKLGEPNNRIGLTVLDLLDIGSYFMIGKNSLPGMPPLPTTPIDFQAELPSFNAKNPRSPQVGTGSGFAFGQQVDVNTGKLKFLIFYAHMAIAFGYDISVLDLDADCQYSEGKMGLNGWYAMGQVYAGIDAAVGLDINLWFLRADVELFHVGLYAGLQAGLPNPTWLKGQVAGEYSALKGLLKGHCTFKFNYGNKCDLDGGDPFGGVKVIADIKPTGNDVDVFSYPEVAYNLPIGEAMSIQTVDDEDQVTVTTFRFGVKRFEIENLKTKTNVAGSHELVNKHMSSLFTPDEMLDEKTEYNLTIEVYGDKLVKGKWQRIGEKNNPNVEHLENEKRTFRTGDAPETFVNSNIIATLPGRMQRYFHYSQTSKGFIAFNQYPSNIPKMKPKDDDYTYKFIARFQQVGSGSSIAGESPIIWEPGTKRVSFGLPPGLKPKTIYIVQVVRQKVKNPQKMFSSGSSSGSVSSTVVSKNIGDGQTIGVRESRLNAIKLGDNEFLVYQMAFKTSQYSTFKGKLDDYLAGSREVSTGVGDYKNTVYVRYTGKEPLDWYDLHQSTYLQGSVTKYVEPNVTITARDRSGALNDPLWLFMKEYYFDYLKDHYLNTMLRSEVNQNKLNPRVFRTYPSAGAYPPGSRLTNGTLIPDLLFPENAVGMWYEGNGTVGKLTNDEINASYWKNIDDGGVANGFVVKAFKAPDQKNNTPFNNGMSLAQNTVNKLVIRYDAITVLVYDRAKVLKEMISRYGLNPSGLGMNQKFQGYLMYNNPTLMETGKENPNYWDLKLRKNSPYVIDINFGYGSFIKKEIQIKLP